VGESVGWCDYAGCGGGRKVNRSGGGGHAKRKMRRSRSAYRLVLKRIVWGCKELWGAREREVRGGGIQDEEIAQGGDFGPIGKTSAHALICLDRKLMVGGVRGSR